jgi:hypothetical protein
LNCQGIGVAARHQPLDAVLALRALDRVEIDMAVEYLVRETHDPRLALAHFAVGNGRQVRPKRPAERRHHVLGRFERDAAHKKNFLTHGAR